VACAVPAISTVCVDFAVNDDGVGPDLKGLVTGDVDCCSGGNVDTIEVVFATDKGDLITLSDRKVTV